MPCIIQLTRLTPVWLGPTPHFSAADSTRAPVILSGGRGSSTSCPRGGDRTRRRKPVPWGLAVHGVGSIPTGDTSGGDVMSGGDIFMVFVLIFAVAVMAYDVEELLG